MLLDKPDWVERADEAIVTIQSEFLRRQRLHQTRDYLPMLGALGYHVRQHGWKHTERRRLLLWIVDGELPTLNDDRYTRAWGRPGSLRRIKRMYDDIGLYARIYGSGPGMEITKSRWEADRAFLRGLAIERFPERMARK